MEMYDRLINYKKHHGSTCVPHSYKADPKLGLWVSTQRANYNTNKSRLTADRIAQLNTIGFVWNHRHARNNKEPGRSIADEDPHTEAQKEESHDEKTYTVSASVKTNSKNIGPYSDLLMADYLVKEGRNIGPYSDLLVADYSSNKERNRNERRQVWEEKF